MKTEFPNKTAGKIFAVSLSQRKGERKKNVASARLKKDHGLLGDAHAGEEVRQVSLMAIEDIRDFNKKGAHVRPGDFAENITVTDLNLRRLKIGDRLKLGKSVVLEVSQIGKTCHSPCGISKELGDCIMPRFGVFAKVIKGGQIRPQDKIGRIRKQTLRERGYPGREE
jgi:MOSC domain-containing protein YiiM